MITLGCLLTLPLVVALIISVSGFRLQIADQHYEGISNADSFRQTLDAMPVGASLYWVGWRSDGFHESWVGCRTDCTRGVLVMYQKPSTVSSDRNVSLNITTYTSRERPPPEADTLGGKSQRIVGSVITATDQLVLLSCYKKWVCASPADVERIKHDLRPATIDEVG
jgi:hypothetical protein